MEALFNLLFGLQQDYGINEEELEEMVITLLNHYQNYTNLKTNTNTISV